MCIDLPDLPNRLEVTDGYQVAHRPTSCQRVPDEDARREFGDKHVS